MKLKNKLFRLMLRIDGIRITFIDNNDGLASSRRNLFGGALMGGMFTSLTAGVFLTSIILYLLGDSDSATQNNALGMVTIVSLACGLTQLVAPMIMERFKRRKKLLLILRVIYHLLNIVILGLIPALPISVEAKLYLFIGVLIVASLIVNISSAAFSVWHVSDLPDKTRTHYFTLVNMVSPIVTSLLATFASFYIDKATADGRLYIGLLVLRAIALIFAAAEIYFFTKIVEPEYPTSGGKKNFFSMLILPFKTPVYLLTVGIIFIYSFGANFMGQYFTAYLLEDVGLSYALISGMGIANIPCALLMYPVWSKVIRKTSWMKTLCIGGILYCTPYILNAFTAEVTTVFYIISCISAYTIGPALTLVFSNLPYMNIPRENQTSYIAFYSTMSSLSGFLSSIVAKAIIAATDDKYISIFGLQMQNRQYMNFIPCILLLCMTLFAFFIEKFGKKPEM